MATGTGLPGNSRRPVVTQAPPSVGLDPRAAAAPFSALMQMGERVSAIGNELDAAATARTQATLDLDHRRAAIDIRAQHPDDPVKFETAWNAYAKGRLDEVDLSQADYARMSLNKAFLSVYDNVTSAAVQKDRRLTANALDARLGMADSDVIDAASRGDQARLVEALADARRQLDAGVAAGLWSQDHVEKEMERRSAVARGEAVLAGVTRTFWSEGSDAASRFIDQVAPSGFDALAERVKAAESSGRHFSRDGQPLMSSAGAIGIMQVMPGTGPEAASAAGLPWDAERLRTDAAYNETLGKAYLRKQLEKYGGNEVLAAAAYNAGPGKVDEWLKTIGDPRTGAISDADFAAKIPFAETRKYVAKVARPGGDGRGSVAVSDSAFDIPGLSPQERDALRNRARSHIRQLENEAGDIVSQWAEGKDPLQAYSMLTSGGADANAAAAFSRLGIDGRVRVKRALLELASSEHAARQRAEKEDRDRRDRESTRLLYDLYSLPPTDAETPQKREEIAGMLRNLGTVEPGTFKAIVEANRNAGQDNPELVFDMENRIEAGRITSADQLTPFLGRGLTFDTARRLSGKLANGTDERYKTGLSRIRAASGLVEGVSFMGDSAEAKAASRMRIAYDDAIDEARERGEPFDPVSIAKQIIAADQNDKRQRGADPMAQTYRAEIDAAKEKLRAANIRDKSGNLIVLDFDDMDDLEAARRLSDPQSGIFGMFKSELFTERELRSLRTAITKLKEAQ